MVFGLVLLALLVAQFTKTKTLFKKTYSLELTSSDIGGIRTGASVLMAGIQIGSVKNIYLGDGGHYGVIKVSILEEYPIRNDAIFGMQQSGFLGDQHVSVTAMSDTAPLLKDGDRVKCKPPFSIDAVATSATKLMETIESTVGSLTQVIGKLNNQLLTEETSTNVAEVIRRVKNITQNVDLMMTNVQQNLFSSNGALAEAIGNLSDTASVLGDAAEEIRQIAASNKDQVGTTITNFSHATEHLKSILKKVDNSEGMLGSIINDPSIKQQLQTTLSNVTVLTDGLKKYGVISYYRKTKKLRKESDEN